MKTSKVREISSIPVAAAAWDVEALHAAAAETVHFDAFQHHAYCSEAEAHGGSFLQGKRNYLAS